MVWAVATTVLVVLRAIDGRFFLAAVMGEQKGPQAGDVMRRAQL